MMKLTIIILALLVVAPVVEAARAPLVERGKITRFADAGDKWKGGKSRCLGRRVEADDVGVAHRRLPCGTLVRVTNHRTGLVVVAPVLDAGPYGAMHDGAWVVKRRASDPGVWRGVLDATPPVFHALGARSFDRVTVEELRP